MCVYTRLLVGADKFTSGREKVKKVEEGSVLRSRDGFGFEDGITTVTWGLYCTFDIGWIWKYGNCSTNGRLIRSQTTAEKRLPIIYTGNRRT